ncbi:MAG: FmdB family zinc ribbon protein [Acidimicrobiia bacterium]
MPTYQYHCAKCGETFELWQSITDDALKKHPGCGGKVTKVLGSVGIVLKGSGFYRTDNRSSRPAAKTDSSSTSKKDSTGSSGSDGSSSSSSSGSSSSGSPSSSASSTGTGSSAAKSA